jgi:WD40 repeat protein
MLSIRDRELKKNPIAFDGVYRQIPHSLACLLRGSLLTRLFGNSHLETKRQLSLCTLLLQPFFFCLPCHSLLFFFFKRIMSLSPSQLGSQRLKNPIFSFAVSSANYFAGHHNGLITVGSVDFESGDTQEIAAHSGCVSQLVVVDNSTRKIVLSSSADMLVKAWGLNDSQWVMTFKGHEASVDCIAVDNGKGILYSGSASGEVRIWDLDSGECKQSLKCHVGRITAICLPSLPPPVEGVELLDEAPRPNTFITTSNDTLAKVIEPSTKLVHVVLRAEKAILSVAYIHPVVYLGCSDGAVRGYHIHTAQHAALLRGHADGVNSLCVLSHTYLLSVSDDRTAKMWNLKTWEPYATFSGAHEQCVTSIAAHTGSGQESKFFTAGFDGVIVGWSAQNIVQRILAEQASVSAAVAAQKKKKGDGSVSPRKKK